MGPGDENLELEMWGKKASSHILSLFYRKHNLAEALYLSAFQSEQSRS
jgi:hypothetical protein